MSVRYLSAGFSCTFCERYAPTHNNGKFKYVIVFSQTGEWGMCCKDCAEKTADLDTNIDFVYKQDENGNGWELGKECPKGFVNFPDS